MKKLFVSLFSFLIILLAQAQSPEDTTDGRFRDELLNNLVGKWDVTATVHETKFTLDLDAEWVLDHQYLEIHWKSHQVVPWLKIPFEEICFVGYNRLYKRYFVHEVSVHGGGGSYEGFCYAYKTGNEIKFVMLPDSDKTMEQRFIWEPKTKSWSIVSRQIVDGKEGEPYIVMKLTARK